LYTAAAGMITQQRRHDAITNNIANLNTPGYKEQQAIIRSFPEMLVYLVGGDAPGMPSGFGSRAIGRINSGVMVEEIVPNFTPGTLQETGNPHDFALISNIRVFEEAGGEQVEIAFDASGIGVNAAGETVYQPQAFFTVWNEAGEARYTRNGSFYLDAEGGLRTSDGHRVIGADGLPIVLGVPLNEVRMAPNGALFDARTGEPLPGEPALMISRIDNPFNLVREGAGIFRLADADANPPAAANPADFAVRQGFIEQSNVDAAQSMVDMMTALRIYEANQRVIQYYDRSLEKAVNEIGRV
jgi:flagellar basal-body rod protein FlgG